MLLIVLIAAMPSAPPRIAAAAAGPIRSTFGVSFAITGIPHPRFAAAVYFSTSSGICPMSLPSPSSIMFGQLKFSSTASAPFASHSRASSLHSASSFPIIEARITFLGYFSFSRRKISMFSATLWSLSCSMFLNPMIPPSLPLIAENRGEASRMSRLQIVLKQTPAHPASKARAHMSYVLATTELESRKGFSIGIPQRSHRRRSSSSGNSVSHSGRT